MFIPQNVINAVQSEQHIDRSKLDSFSLMLVDELYGQAPTFQDGKEDGRLCYESGFKNPADPAVRTPYNLGLIIGYKEAGKAKLRAKLKEAAEMERKKRVKHEQINLAYQKRLAAK